MWIPLQTLSCKFSQIAPQSSNFNSSLFIFHTPVFAFQYNIPVPNIYNEIRLIFYDKDETFRIYIYIIIKISQEDPYGFQ